MRSPAQCHARSQISTRNHRLPVRRRRASAAAKPVAAGLTFTGAVPTAHPGRGRDHACPPGAGVSRRRQGFALPNRAARFQATTPSEAAKPTKSPRPPQAVTGPAVSDGCKPRDGALPLLLLALPPAKSKIAIAAANDRGIFLIALHRRLGAALKPRAGRRRPGRRPRRVGARNATPPPFGALAFFCRRGPH